MINRKSPFNSPPIHRVAYSAIAAIYASECVESLSTKALMLAALYIVLACCQQHDEPDNS